MQEVDAIKRLGPPLGVAVMWQQWEGPS